MSEVYCLNKEDWTWCDENHIEIIKQYLGYLDSEEIKNTIKVKMYRGTLQPKTFEDYLDVDSIVDQMREWAYDDFNDFAESYLDEVTSEQKQELHQLIKSWADKHSLCPSFHSVSDIVEVEFDIPEDI